jgi:hypothetical protein
MRADEKMKQGSRAYLVCALLALAPIASARAQTPPDTGEVHGLNLGLRAEAMKTDDWGELACGSNGGPPRQRLNRWSEFKKCRPESSGLHEVYARFDDEAEYIGKALDDPLYAGQHSGTRVAGHPVILSALFDDNGVLRGIRMVSDPRATPIERRMAHLLKVAVMNHYDPGGWSCKDFPPDPGETPVGGVFIKQRCEKITAERTMTVEAHFLRKPGQNAIDPETKEYTQGQFESWTRFELMDPSNQKQ